MVLNVSNLANLHSFRKIKMRLNKILVRAKYDFQKGSFLEKNPRGSSSPVFGLNCSKNPPIPAEDASQVRERL